MFYPIGGERRLKVWAADDTAGVGSSDGEAGTVVEQPAVSPPAAEGVSPAPEPAGSEAASAVQAPVAAKPKEEAKVKEDWRDRRIAQLTARLRATEQQKPAEPASQPAAGSGTGPSTVDLVRREAERLATELEVTREFNRQCEATAAAGRTAFGKEAFDGRVQQLTQVVDRSDPASLTAYNLLLHAAIETGKGPELIHRLGGDLNEASRLMALPPVKLGIELAKLAAAPQVELSAAPKPIRPVTNRGASHEAIDPTDNERAGQLSTAEWMRRREEQLVERRKRA